MSKAMADQIHPKRLEQLKKQASEQAELAGKLLAAAKARKEAAKALRKAEGLLNRTDTEVQQIGHKLATSLEASFYFMDGVYRIGMNIDGEWRELHLESFTEQAAEAIRRYEEQ